MKNLFKKAHEMTRKMKEEYPEVDYQAQFGLYVSFLFEEGEEETVEIAKLEGSDKQVTWAEDIREEQLESYNRFKERWIEKREMEENQKELDYIKSLTEKILSIKKAETWIDMHQADITLHQLLVPKRRKGILERMETLHISL